MAESQRHPTLKATLGFSALVLSLGAPRSRRQKGSLTALHRAGGAAASTGSSPHPFLQLAYCAQGRRACYSSPDAGMSEAESREQSQMYSIHVSSVFQTWQEAAQLALITSTSSQDLQTELS